MEIRAITNSSEALLRALNKAVKDETIKTWVMVKAAGGESFLTHKPEQWYNKALLDFQLTTKYLLIKITWYGNQEPREDIKGYYTGRFTEVLMVHFKDFFSHLEIYP